MSFLDASNLIFVLWFRLTVLWLFGCSSLPPSVVWLQGHYTWFCTHASLFLFDFMGLVFCDPLMKCNICDLPIHQDTVLALDNSFTFVILQIVLPELNVYLLFIRLVYNFSCSKHLFNEQQSPQKGMFHIMSLSEV